MLEVLMKIAGDAGWGQRIDTGLACDLVVNRTLQVWEFEDYVWLHGWTVSGVKWFLLSSK